MKSLHLFFPLAEFQTEHMSAVCPKWLMKEASRNTVDMGWKQKLVFLVLKRPHLPRMSLVK